MSEELSVEYRDGEIVVTQPGTSFSATYGKERDSPSVLLLAATLDQKASREAIFKFRADAFVAAVQKARKLGWIV
jgi:hypothetical protein